MTNELNDPEELIDNEEPVAFVPLCFIDVVMALPNPNPVVVLEEIEVPHRRLHIPVGMAEGVAIGYGAKGLATPKPLTHALLSEIVQSLGGTFETVRLTAVAGGSFYAEVVVSGAFGNKVFACRPSDGIAIALRQELPVPITATPAVLDQVGVLDSNGS